MHERAVINHITTETCQTHTIEIRCNLPRKMGASSILIDNTSRRSAFYIAQLKVQNKKCCQWEVRPSISFYFKHWSKGLKSLKLFWNRKLMLGCKGFIILALLSEFWRTIGCNVHVNGDNIVNLSFQLATYGLDCRNITWWNLFLTFRWWPCWPWALSFTH